MKKAKEYEVTLRVTGSLAIRLQCPDHKKIAYHNNRHLNDIDLVTYAKDIVKVQDLFFDLDWKENQNVLRLFGNKRRIFYHPKENLHSDIFIDKLRFCHEIDLRKRLEIDPVTISLIDLLLAKLQIVKINKKDIIDLLILLSQYPVSGDGNEKDKIDGAYLAKICSKDWGWWKTVTTNIQKAKELAGEYLVEDQAEKVNKELDTLLTLIKNRTKSLLWKIRAKIGEKKIWYNKVEEVDRD